ncbi:uncharacterized protein LOC135340957 isoform X2 [Halichondria panicea]|uniref:uncharacterized protein LOC135340957 isoform X2 n=1 Tax=Halichondria panicea TaxID=6063 RepID=UPI00312B622F
MNFLLHMLCAVVSFKQHAVAIGSLTSTPESTNGIVTACLGDPISITCTHNITIGGITEWRLPGVSAQCLVVHGSPTLPICAPFTVTMVSGGSTLSSTVEITATEGLSGEVECLSGQNAALVSVLASINISVAAIPTPSITMVEQTSQSMASVSLSVDNTQCAAIYVVNATQDGGGGSVSGGSSSTSPVTVDGLDVCGYSYSFVGFVITPSGVSGDTSAPYSFTADLSGVNDIISNVHTNSERTVLQWDQLTNIDYPDCITSYSIGWNGITYNTIDTATFVTRELLRASGFPFCTTTSVTVTPVTSMELLAGRNSTADVSLISPDFITPTISGVYNVKVTNRTVFTGMVQGISQIVNPSRMIGYNRVGIACTPNIVFTGESFEVTLPDDADSEETFTMCVQLIFGNCMELKSIDFTIPGRTITAQNGRMVLGTTNFTVTVNLPITEYQPDQLQIVISLTPNDTAPVVTDFPTSYQYTVMFSGLMTGRSYIYTVRVVRRSDMTTDVVEPFEGSFTIVVLFPPVTIASSTGQPTSAYTITLTLPEINYPHSELIIISTLTPTDSVPITDDFPFSSQYSVTFNRLSDGVVYSYSIRVVLRTNTSLDVSIPVTGSFTLMTSFSTGAAVALTFVLTFLLTLVIGISIGVFIVLTVNKYRRSEKVTLQTDTEMIPPPVIYEEPEAIKPDPLTQGNAAYGEIVY